MRPALAAELFLQLRRRAFAVSAGAFTLVALAFSTYRFFTSSSDVQTAVAAAVAQAEQLAAATGSPIDAAATYVEPRYMFASQYPYDIAGGAIAALLIFLVGGAILAGGDWRTRSARTTFASWNRRGPAALTRAAIWTGLSALVGFLGLALMTALLAGTAAARGSLAGFDVMTVALLLARGALLAAAGGLMGAGLGTALRSDVAVVVALLAYILVVETLLPLLAPTGGRASPGSRLLAWVVSNDPQRGFPVSCDVPRCADPVFSGWGWRASYALGIGAAALLLVVVFLTSRRADWG